MPDDKKAEIKPEKKTQTSTLPNEKQKTSNADMPDVRGSDKEEAKQVEAKDIPESVSERTKEQFEKLKRHNAELRKRLDTYEGISGVNVSAFSPPQSSKSDDWYDPNTGEVDVQSMYAWKKDLEDRVKYAESTSKNVASEIEGSTTQEVYSKHPELNPDSDNFSDSLHKLTRAMIMDSMAYPESYGGNKLSFKQAADLAKKYQFDSDKAEQEKNEIIKQDASLDIGGRPGQSVAREEAKQDQRNLSVRTRHGDRKAMIERMRRIREASISK